MGKRGGGSSRLSIGSLNHVPSRSTTMRWCVPRVKASLEKRATSLCGLDISRQKLGGALVLESKLLVQTLERFKVSPHQQESYSLEGCTRGTPVLLLPLLFD